MSVGVGSTLVDQRRVAEKLKYGVPFPIRWLKSRVFLVEAQDVEAPLCAAYGCGQFVS